MEIVLRLLRSLLFVVGLLVFGCSGCSSSIQDPPLFPSVVVPRAFESTVLLAGYESTDGVCGGVYVDQTHVLTAYHCAIAATQPAEVVALLEQLGLDAFPSPAGKHVRFATHADWVTAKFDEAKVKHRDGWFSAVDVKNDLALITTKERAASWSNVRAADLVVGEAVFTVGHPVGLDYSLARGYVAALRRHVPGMTALYTQVDMTTNPGNSGGGLFDDSGNLVGLMSTSADRFQGLSFFVSLDKIRALVGS